MTDPKPVGALNGILLPEIVLVDKINASLKLLRENYNEIPDKKQSGLALFAGSQKLGNYVLFDELIETIITSGKSPGHILVRHSYDLSDLQEPGAYLNFGNESDNLSSMGLGSGDHGLHYGPEGINDPEGHGNIYSKRYDAEYYLTLIGQNKNQITMLYHFFKALVSSISLQLETFGLQGLKMSGNGMTTDPRVPPNLFVRVLTMSFNYATYSPSLFRETVAPWKGLEIKAKA